MIKAKHWAAIWSAVCMICMMTFCVTAAPETAPSFHRESVKLYLEQEYQLEIQNAGTDDYTLTSSNTSVVKVTSEGKITAVGTGTANINLRKNNTNVARCQVKVYGGKSPQNVVLETQNMELKVGEQRTLYTQITPDSASSKEVTYTSSDETVATVNRYGVIHAEKEGIATITAESNSSAVYKTCVVKVVKQVTASANQVLSGTLTQGEAVLKNRHIQLQNDDGVFEAKTDENGNFTFKNLVAGQQILCVLQNADDSKIVASGVVFLQNPETIINAQIDGMNITVNYQQKEEMVEEEKPEKIILSKDSITLDAKETYQMIFDTEPAGLEVPRLNAVTSNELIATVDNKGLITAIGEGTATITFQSEENDYQAVCEVIVQHSEKTTYSLWIILLEVLLVIAVIVIFIIQYRAYVKKKTEEEMIS